MSLGLFRSKYKNKGKAPDPKLAVFTKPIPATAPIIRKAGDYQCDLMFVPDYTKFNSGKGVIQFDLDLENKMLHYILNNVKMQFFHSDVVDPVHIAFQGSFGGKATLINTQDK